MKTTTSRANPMESALSIIGSEHAAFDAALAAVMDRIQVVREHRAEPDAASFERNISYLATFMDHFHHPKEDDHLFRAVSARSGEGSDLIDHLQHDHRQAPAIFAELLRCLRAAREGSPAAFGDFGSLFERYARDQLRHMRQENEELLPLAQRVLRATDWVAIEAAFAANRDPLFSAKRAASPSTTTRR